MKYVTAILESIIQCECSIKEHWSIFACFLRGAGNLHQCPTLHLSLHEYYIGILLYSYNVQLCIVSCSLYCLLSFTVLFIIKNLREAKKGLGGTKPPFALPHKNAYVYKWC